MKRFLATGNARNFKEMNCKPNSVRNLYVLLAVLQEKTLILLAVWHVANFYGFRLNRAVKRNFLCVQIVDYVIQLHTYTLLCVTIVLQKLNINCVLYLTKIQKFWSSFCLYKSFMLQWQVKLPTTTEDYKFFGYS